MRGRAIVLHQEVRPGSVVDSEATNELDVRRTEGVDILVVISNSENGELALGVPDRAAGERRDKLVLALVDVLVFVDQYVGVAGESAVTVGIRLKARISAGTKDAEGFLDEPIELQRLSPALERPGERALHHHGILQGRGRQIDAGKRTHRTEAPAQITQLEQGRIEHMPLTTGATSA